MQFPPRDHRERSRWSAVTRGSAVSPALLTIAQIATLLAVWYRFGYNLTVDEPFMANMARRPWPELWDVFPVDNVPLAYVALKCWTAVFGESEVALRTLSALFFGAMVLMTGAAAHRTAGPTAGIAAAVLASAATASASSMRRRRVRTDCWRV